MFLSNQDIITLNYKSDIEEYLYLKKKYTSLGLTFESLSKLFIGISSGLSWLSWATDTPTVLISGFSETYTEPSSCYRLGAPEGKCKGCFNSHKLDAGDWNWCPIHKGTNKQFECSKTITSKSVIEKLKYILTPL